MKESCALVIIGNGYAGICALNAAAQYHKRGDKIIVLDQGMAWGGQWVYQYGQKRTRCTRLFCAMLHVTL